MRVKLMALRDPNKKILSIKTIRAVTLMGLQESKAIVDDMNIGGRPTVDVLANNGEAILGEFFLYKKIDELKLFMCKVYYDSVRGVETRKILLLAYTKEDATAHADSGYTGATVDSVKEITGPFDNGTILMDIIDY